jgi:hypothetical protein
LKIIIDLANQPQKFPYSDMLEKIKNTHIRLTHVTGYNSFFNGGIIIMINKAKK